MIGLLKSFWTAATQLLLNVAQERQVDQTTLERYRGFVFDESEFSIHMPIWVDPLAGRVVCFSDNFGIILSVSSAARAQFVRHRDDDDDHERCEYYFSLGQDVDRVIFKSEDDNIWKIPIMFPFLTLEQARQVCGYA
jgi:hypothetical protein